MTANGDSVKLFGMSNLLIERELDKLEKELNIDLGRTQKNDKDDEYYPQFQGKLKQEASDMGDHYELFYCLEKTIRKLIAETLTSAHGETWWSKCIPDEIKKNVNDNMRREIDSGVTPRSEYEIDYTTFGELGKIVETKWENFDAIFSSSKAFSKIMANLNTLRGPIAHCSPLAEDEVIRLKLAVKDWFRLME